MSFVFSIIFALGYIIISIFAIFAHQIIISNIAVCSSAVWAAAAMIIREIRKGRDQ